MSSTSELTEELDAALAALQMEGHWKSVSGGLPPAPAGRGEPHLWRWSDIHPKLMEAGDLLGTDEGASRRTLRLCTPGMARKSTMHTFQTSVQMLNPGEMAQSHRHSISAFRFVIRGSGAHTTIDGDRVIMELHDLVLTPQGCWHGHGNELDEPVVWIDGHDGPLLFGLDAVFFQGWQQNERAFPMPSSHAGRPYVFKGREALATLKSLPDSAWSPFDGRTLDYNDPVSGGPTLPTIACRLHFLRPSEATRYHRHTAATIYYVVEGSGTSMAGDKRLDWSAGDFFVVPNWAWHSHRINVGASAVLFSASDEPLLAAIGQFRTETLPETSEIISTGGRS